MFRFPLGPYVVARDGERVANPPDVKLLEYKPVDTTVPLQQLDEPTFPLYRLLQAI